ncbi:hypothetical protein Pla100_19510 [Neorhodopirellula pilleata]|uniref:Uncharacterized protein n=1 Tax=Neorhodopirellula pilleata TaxID=2714738 RepID=A0A5C6AHZ0_9BACT|nr:hypothetical protein Pla100_19510 [Neorhodopirellula pilleata]
MAGKLRDECTKWLCERVSLWRLSCRETFSSLPFPRRGTLFIDKGTLICSSGRKIEGRKIGADHLLASNLPASEPMTQQTNQSTEIAH